MNNPIYTAKDARAALENVLPYLADDGGLENSGSERRYQLHVAMLLTKLNHLLPHQLEVEARIIVNHPITENFRRLPGGGHRYSERIVDIILLSSKFTGHYSRENMPAIIRHTKMLIEVKSVNFSGRIKIRGVVEDIDNLIAVREELSQKGGEDIILVALVFDTTRNERHRIKPSDASELIEYATQNDVEVCLFTQAGMKSTNGMKLQ